MLDMMPVEIAPSSISTFKPHWDLYPRTYVASKTSFPLIDNLDGDLTKEVWKDVPWSDYFDDIRGADDSPDSERPDASCQTRFKAVWDETHLYIGAILESDFETQAHFTERNSPIYQRDSDFEVFVDPVGSCHNYKELEVNALNTIWNLMLDKPYGDDGVEHSGRIARPGDKLFYEVYHQKTAARVLKGKLNDSKEPATWSVEIAISHQDILSYVSDANGPPSIGSWWRINFSRVERKGGINWTWQPQIVWDPTKHRYAGFVQMHLPDAWGYMVFGGPPAASNREQGQRDPSWPARLAAMNAYYAQKAFYAEHTRYGSTLEQLSSYMDKDVVAPFDIHISLGGSDEFVVTVNDHAADFVVTVTGARYLKVRRMETTDES